MELIKNIIPGVVGHLAGGNLPLQIRVQEKWEKILTPQEKKHVSIIGFKQGQLLVNVDSPAWAFRLNIKKAKLAEELKKEFPDFKGINFQLGKIV